MSRIRNLPWLLFIALVSFTCQKNENPIGSNASAHSSSNVVLKKVLEEDLYMPDAVPDIVNDRALEICLKNGYSNIRILGVKNSKNPDYHIYFFEDNQEGIKAFVLSLNNDKNAINIEQEVSLPYDGSKLHKPLDDYKCWKLATIYDGTNYSGSSFQFSQGTTTYGWYHKAIDCLATTYVCCNGTYNANFNNIISSSYWEDDYYSPEGRIARAINLSAWVNCSKLGDRLLIGDEDWRKDTRFSSTATKGTVCHQTMLAPDWGDAGFDNMMSCLDMFYRVYTPTSCY